MRATSTYRRTALIGVVLHANEVEPSLITRENLPQGRGRVGRIWNDKDAKPHLHQLPTKSPSPRYSVTAAFATKRSSLSRVARFSEHEPGHHDSAAWSLAREASARQFRRR